MVWEGRVESWIFMFCWIFLRTVSFAHSDENNCDVQWNIEYEKNLIIVWTVSTNHEYNVSISYNSTDAECKNKEGSIEADSEAKQIELSILCSNTNYTLDANFSCTIVTSTTLIWTPPGPPLNITINDDKITNQSFFLSWNPPKGNGKIVNYEISLNVTLEKYNTNKTEYLVTNLTSFTNYEVQISAKNEEYSGESSLKKNVKTKEGIPSLPTKISIDSFTSTSIFLTWEEPTPFVGPIENFEVQWKKPGEKNALNSTTIQKSFNISSLEPYSDYAINVRAKTSAGFGEWTDPKLQKTAAGIPLPPTYLSINSFTSIGLSVTWKDPVTFVGPIEMFEIECNDFVEQNKSHFYTKNKYFVITDLSPYRNYSTKVRARTSAGAGPWTDEVTQRTAAGVPFPPKNFHKKSITQSSIYLEWEEPETFMGPIVNYTIICTDELEVFQMSTAETSVNITNLEPFTMYKVKVSAATEADWGNWTENKAVKTSIGVPYPPKELKIRSVTNSSITLVWVEPSPLTGPISDYVVHWSNVTTKCEKHIKSSRTLYTVKELLPYVNYSFRVAAVTEAGRGNWSEEIFKRTGIGVPHTPTALKKDLVTNTSIMLTWTEPRPSTGPIFSYVIKWNSSVESGMALSYSNETKYTVKRLSAYVNYRFWIQAETAAGRGSWSGSIVVRTDVGVPHEPTDVKAASVTNTSILLTWKEPSPFMGPIESYVVCWISSRGIGINETYSEDIQFNVTNLLPFINYTFNVLAITAAGKGNWSVNVIVQTDIGVPTVPRNLMKVEVSDVKAIIKWNQPIYTNAPELQYHIEWHKNVSNITENIILPSPNILEISHLIADLMPFSNYSIRVAAISEAGQGPWTEHLIFETKVGAPLPAILVDVLANQTRTAFVKWSTRGPYPGPITYSLEAWKMSNLCSSQPSYHFGRKIRGSKNPEDWKSQVHEDSMMKLEPYGSYRFLIILSTSAKNVSSDQSRNVRIPPEAAEEPEDVIADCSYSSTEAKISWKPPKKFNGIISSYNIRYEIEKQVTLVNIAVKNPCKVSNHVLKNLRPERPISLYVYALVVNVTLEGKPSYPKETCILPAGIPFIGNASRILAKGSGTEYLILEWTKDTFSEYMGSITHYSVFVGRRNTLGNATSGKVAEIGPSWLNFNSGTSEFYQATPPSWNPFNTDADPLQCKMLVEIGDDGKNRTFLRCVVGSQPCPDNETFCNGPLKPNTQYEIKIRGFTRGGYTETHLIYANTKPLPQPSKIGMIVAVVIILLAVVCFSAGGYYMKKRGYLDPLINVIHIRFKRRDGVSSKSNNETSLQSMEPYSTPKPIKIKYFDNHVRHRMRDSHVQFSQEFEMLNKKSPNQPCTVADMEENRFKNRWKNIFPFDHSRVKLLPLCDEPGSDFINANYIPGNTSQREYIATQGPLPHTVEDFWRMVWEQSVSIIIMLTQCEERGKNKCEQYWPNRNESRKYGDLVITTTEEFVLTSYIVRLLWVQLDSHQREIKQMHFTNWPDFGCPQSPGDLINFVRSVREQMPRVENGPLIVHCSAGVGRTGTFIVVDRLVKQLQRMSSNDTINIYDTILELRNYRVNMVQTEDQYIYIHLCALQLIQEQSRILTNECEDQVNSHVLTGL